VYFVIRNDPDKAVENDGKISRGPDRFRVDQCTKEELLDRLVGESGKEADPSELYYGTNETLDAMPVPPARFPVGKLLIVKGEVVKPRPKRVVTEFEIE